uniref:Myb/SANT-like domain-containing protein n=1 Tax=Gossypium raimondii TaxID=29730 RepID=A0A0D2RCK5_GOSRA|nr:hypothetical protein B456_005G105100 [Gossypium raimondii]
MTNFDKETIKAYSQRQLKNRWDAFKKEWKAWKKLKCRDTSLGWNPIKRIVDAPDDWHWSKFEGKLNQMFIEVVTTGDKAWAPSFNTLRSEFFKDVDNKIHEKNEEESVKNDVHISNDVQIDGKVKKGKHLRYQLHILKLEGRNPQSKLEGLQDFMDPYGIPQAVKLLDSISEEVPKASPLYFFSLKLLLNKDKRIMFL